MAKQRSSKRTQVELIGTFLRFIRITTKIFKINGDTQNNHYKLNQWVFYRIHKHEKDERQFSENKNINIYIDIDKVYASLLSNNVRELLVSTFLLLYSFSLGDWIDLANIL